MAHKITRFALTELYGKPHLVTESALLPILEYVDMRNLESFKYEEYEDDDNEDEEKQPKLYDGIGVIKIHGSLTYRQVDTVCGAVGTSYQGILQQADSLIAAGASTIVLDVNSGGGEAYSCFTTANELRKRCDESDVKLVSFVDGSSCSAAYALSCVADEVIVHPNANIGSIGCVICLYNDSEALKKEGVERMFISYPKDKVPFDKEGKFTEKFTSRLENSVKELALEFFDHVSAHTSIPTQAIEDLGAQVFSAKEALDIGLVNKIMDQREFGEYLTKNYTKPKQWGF